VEPSAPPRSDPRSVPRGLFAGLALGAILAAAVWRPWQSRAFVEQVVERGMAPSAEAQAWQEQRDLRGRPVDQIPDPPGEGPVVTARYWLSLPPYEMEVRRRGHRCVISIHGVDAQVSGGGWTAFAEGTITGSPDDFRGAEARIVWSCIGLRLRRSSAGVGKLTFSRDGREVEAVYLQGAEALSIPAADTYVKAYGRLAVGAKPSHGALRGQIPYTQALARHADDARIVVSGRVTTPAGAVVPDAVVQLQGRDATRVHADEEGRFRLEFRGKDAPWSQSLCAGAFGYRNGETALFTGDPTDDVRIELAPLDLTDHPEYRWVHPAPDRDADQVQACGTCHSWQYAEWIGSRHARMADHGHVTWERARMLRSGVGAPDDCAACHQPAHAASTGDGAYLPRGVLASNHCDFCHKATHTADPARSGVFGSLVLARPDPLVRDRPGDIHRVFGPSPDVSYAYMGASFDPAHSTSWLCAGCHQGGGVPGRAKVDTFEEWKTWAASREDERFRSCQDCHMPGASTINDQGKPIDHFAWQTLHRSPLSVHSHAFRGTEPSFAKDALGLDAQVRWDAVTTRWVVDVALENRGAGHAIPTGTWTKHVVVGVWARQGGRWLRAAGGARTRLVADDDAPAEPLAAGDWRNPGGLVLGVLDKRAGEAPATFWDPPPPEDLLDARLRPDEKRTFSVAFSTPEGAPGERPVVELRVVHRRGAIGPGPEATPWDRALYDPPPEVEWLRLLR